MGKSKRLLSLLTAATLAASSFSALVISASAADDKVLDITPDMTYVSGTDADVDTAKGYVDTATTGYNTLSGGNIGWGNKSWSVNNITYLKVDASEVVEEGLTLKDATLTFQGSGSTDSKRTQYYGVGYTSYTDWDDTLTYNIASENGMTSVTSMGDSVWGTSKSATTFEAYSFDVLDAFAEDEDGIVTLVIYATSNAGGGYIKSPSVKITATDAAVYTATVKVVCDGEVISETTASVTEGSVFTPTYEESFNKDGYKYTYVSGADSVEITGDVTIELEYSKRPLAETTYTVKGVAGAVDLGTVATGTVTEDSTVKANYPKYVVNSDKLYSIAEGDRTIGYYAVDITGTQDDQTIEKEYAEDDLGTPVYYAEAEDIWGDANVSNSNIRASNGKVGTITEDTTVLNLSAGTYKIITAVWGGGSNDASQSTYTFTVGENEYEVTTTGSRVEKTFDEFTLEEAADLVVSVEKGTSGAGVDYILITGGGTATEPDPEESEQPTEPVESEQPTEPVETDAPAPTPKVEPVQIYTQDVSEVASGQKSKKMIDAGITAPTEADILAYSVEDFGTGKTDITDPIPALDGWGYKHYAYTALESGKNRETSVSIDPTTNTVTVEGVGNANCDGAISYIPANDDDVTLPEGAPIIYTFDAVVTTTAGNAAGSPTFGFTSAVNGATVVSEGSVALAAPGVTGQANVYHVVMVDNKPAGTYEIYVNGILTASSADAADEDEPSGAAVADITGIYAQTVTAGRYISAGIRSLSVIAANAPTTVKVTFVNGETEETVAEYDVIPGSTIELPAAPAVEGKTFKEWQDADGKAVTGSVTVSEAAEYTAVYEDEQIATPPPAGEVLYSQDYQSATAADWTTGTGGRYTPIIATQGDNQYLTVDQDSRYNNGATLTSPSYASYVEGVAEYAVEFDVKLGSSNDQAGTTLNVGTLAQIKQDGKNTTKWIVNGATTVELPGTATITDTTLAALEAAPWYHVVVATNGDSTYITIKDAEGTEILPQTLLTPIGTPALANMTFATSRYYADFALDNLVIRTLNENELPDIKFYNVTVNTTRYAKMTAGEDVYYADVNGSISIPNLMAGTAFDYSISKTGYETATGNVSVVDADVTVNAQLNLTEDVVYIESDFGNDSGAFSVSGRNDSIALGGTAIPEVAQIALDLSAGTEETQWTLILKNSAGSPIVGLQSVTGDGLYAFTGWSGNSAMNQYNDVGLYTEGVKISDDTAINGTVNFVIDNVGKSITITLGESSSSLTLIADDTTLGSIAIGKYRTNATVSVNEIRVTEPDATFMLITGDAQVAKVAGKVVTREYGRTETVITPDETFTWTVTEGAGVSIDQNGVLTITDEAVPGKYTITLTGSTGKSATLDVAVEDFANVVPTVDGPKAYNAGGTGTYTVTALVDEYGDDVIDLFAPSFSSSDTSVITVDAETGVATAVANGTANIIVTIGNPGKEASVAVPVTVATYYVVADATGDSTVVDLRGIVTADEYLVTTTDADGNIVKQYTISASDISIDGSTIKEVLSADAKAYTAIYNEDGTLQSVSIFDAEKGYEEEEWAMPNAKRFYWDENMKPVPFETVTVGGRYDITVDTTGATKVEVAPIYKTTMNTVVEVPAGTYNVTVTANNGRRSDVYVNDQMMFNNINQGGDNWTIGRIIATSTDYTAEDVVIAEGYARFNYRDDQSSGSLITAVKFVKTPDNAARAKRIYVIGDSLVANYYGDAPEGQEGLVRTGWGQVFQDYLADGVKATNLGNSGAWATGMLGDAFTNVIGSAQPGDVVVWESGYNDKAHSTVGEMNAAITEAVEVSRAMGLDFYLVTPNASSHDYTGSVAWAGNIRTLAEELDVSLIDLSALSYNFLNDKYSGVDDVHTLLQAVYNNSGDTLHSSYNAANCWAAIVAQGLPGELTNTTHTYTFNDGTNDITVGVGLMPAAE